MCSLQKPEPNPMRTALFIFIGISYKNQILGKGDICMHLKQKDFVFSTNFQNKILKIKL